MYAAASNLDSTGNGKKLPAFSLAFTRSDLRYSMLPSARAVIAEGDSVVFRGNVNFTLASGKKVSVRVITYYRLADGKIVEDEPISRPPLTEVLGGMMPPKSGS
jgi:ketosteroid isomerase-like protein